MNTTRVGIQKTHPIKPTQGFLKNQLKKKTKGFWVFMGFLKTNIEISL